MKTKNTSLTFLLLWLFFISTSNASPYTFKYGFSDGSTIQGGFDGTLVGDMVTVHDGAYFSVGPYSYSSLYSVSYDKVNDLWSTSDGVMSLFDYHKNNIFLIDIDYPNIQSGYTGFLEDVSDYYSSTFGSSSYYIATFNINVGHTSLSRFREDITTSDGPSVISYEIHGTQTPNVPEPEAIAMIGLGLLGFSLSSKRKPQL